jgi:hypothetical protein
MANTTTIQAVNDSVTTLDDNSVLTTIDNPFNPKLDYDKWKEWDEENGYNTESFIARLIAEQNVNFDVDDDLTINNLIDKVYHEILEHDVLNVYILI